MPELPQKAPPLHDLLGFRLLHRQTGEIRLGMEIRPALLNRRGVVHGGVLSALLDAALGGAIVAGIAPQEWCATLQLSVQFLAGARRGPLRAQGRMLRRGRACAFAAGEIHDAPGNLVAQAQGTWYLWPEKPPQPSNVPTQGNPPQHSGAPA